MNLIIRTIQKAKHIDIVDKSAEVLKRLGETC